MLGEVKPLFPRMDKLKTMKEINQGEVQGPTSKVQSQSAANADVVTGTANVPPASRVRTSAGANVHK